MAATYFLHGDTWTVNGVTNYKLTKTAAGTIPRTDVNTFTAAGQLHSVSGAWISAVDEFIAGVPAGTWVFDLYVALTGGGGTVGTLRCTAYEVKSDGTLVQLFQTGASGATSNGSATDLQVSFNASAWNPAAGSALYIFWSVTDPTYSASTQVTAYWDAVGTPSSVTIPTSAGSTSTVTGVSGIISGLAFGGGSGGGGINPNFGSSLPIAIAESNGGVFYVSATGSDAAAGTLAAPWATVEHAMATLTAGQRCFVRGGDYEQVNAATRLVWSAVGTSGGIISIEAYPGESPIIHRNLRITGNSLRLRGLVIERNAFVAARAGNSFGWDTATSTNFPGEVGIWIDATNVHLDKLEIRNQRWSGMLIGSGSNIQLTGCWIHNNGSTHDDHGVYFNGGGASCLLANCVLERNADFGIQFYPAPSGVILTCCTIGFNGSILNQPAAAPYPTYTSAALSYPYGNSTDGSGIIVNSAAAGIQVYNSILYANVTNGIRALGTVTAAQITLANTLAFGHPNGGGGANFDATMLALGTALLQADPKFTSYGSAFPGVSGVPGNYRLAALSPAIGAGLAAYTPPVDFDGNFRQTADLGAYGFAATSPGGGGGGGGGVIIGASHRKRRLLAGVGH